MSTPITIVGGGLAGLTLGIGLRQLGVPVTVWEAGNYPRHRVCGEFINGEGQNSLARLGLMPGLLTAGACPAVNAAFFSSNAAIAAYALPSAALCISRYLLDQWLAREFSRLGGDLRTGTRWTGGFGSGIVRAGGRRAKPVVDGWRLFGLKVHARGLAMIADLEMHFVPSGYVGLCRLADGEVNICGLFRSRTTVPDLAHNWRDWLGGPADSVLRTRLAGARLDEESFCSVAGLCLSPQGVTGQDECCIGDALTMIPPVTGNGMSMAFESAELAIGPLAQYSTGELTWSQAQLRIAHDCSRRFNRRLQWAGYLQQGLFQPLARPSLLFLAAHSSRLWQGLFKLTR
jgi:flavin-dependent dehydrogenase